MKIIAIWDRHKVAPKSKIIFALTACGRFLEVTPTLKYNGQDANGNVVWKETGGFDIGDEDEEKKHWTFKEANIYVHYFGGSLLKQFKEVNSDKGKE